MKKYFYILAALSIAPTFALAQSLENDVDSELDQAYSAPVQRATTADAPAPAPRRASQPIYILNQAPTSTSTSTAQVIQAQPQIQQQQPVQQIQQVQTQPTTEIVASPLGESHAEQIRRARQDAEVQTEQKIVEKLETSRMDDEKKRADVLFGDKFNKLKQDNQQQNQQQEAVVAQPVMAPAPIIQPVYVQPAPVQVVQQPPVAPAPVVAAPEPKENTRDIIREELSASRKQETVVEEPPVSTKYFGIMVGMGNVPDESNIKGNSSLGLSFGNRYDNFILEGSLSYANYTINAFNVWQTGSYNNSGYGYIGNNGTYGNLNVNQYSGAVAGKFQLLSGMFRPVIGALAQYSYRTYNYSNNSNGFSNNNNNNGSSANSSAVDVGALAGVDLELSPKYSVGLDFRYLWNVSNRVNTDNSYGFVSNYGGIESMSYYVTTLTGRMNF